MKFGVSKLGHLGRLAPVLAAAALGSLAGPALAAPAHLARPAAASFPALSLPYQDPDQAGWLTLCGTNLKPVTHGSVTTHPFVWRVVSDVPPPAGYFVKGAKATMFAYQPRQGTPAGAWSGTVMGAASYYHSQAHPMAQFTPIDSPLTQMTQAYPPLWDHLIELRLYLSAPQIPVDMDHYAAADIEVTGNTWQLVAGGHSSCTAGKVTALETSVGMPGSKKKPQSSPSTSPSASAAASASASASASPGSSGSPVGGHQSSSAAPGASPTANAGPSTGPTALSSPSAGGFAGFAIGVVILIAAFIVGRSIWRRRRRATG